MCMYRLFSARFGLLNDLPPTGKELTVRSLCILTTVHRIGSNSERKSSTKFSSSIAKNNVFDCQNRYYCNRKRLICVRRLPFWQSKTLYLAIVNDLPLDKKSLAIAAYPVVFVILVFFPFWF